MQDGQRGQGGGGEAHRVPDVSQHRGGEGGVDQVHPVSSEYYILYICFLFLTVLSFRHILKAKH